MRYSFIVSVLPTVDRQQARFFGEAAEFQQESQPLLWKAAADINLAN